MREICSEIRKLIIKRSIPPGSKLSDVALARQFQVSRTPVREALRHLEAEGFLVYSPNRGFAVNVITIADVDQIYGVRICNEEYAGRLALKAFSEDPGKLARLEQMCKEMEVHYRQNNVYESLKRNKEFHRYIWDSCGNKWLIKIIETLSYHLDRFIVSAIQIPGRSEKTIREHWEIYNGFKSLNEKKVSKAISKHIYNVSLDLKKQIVRML